MNQAMNQTMKKTELLFGVSPINWSNDDEPSLGGQIPLDTMLAEAAQAGYDGVEKGHKFPADPGILRECLTPHGLQLVGGWWSTHLLERSVEDEIQAARPHIELLKAHHCRVFIACETSGSVHGTRSAPLSSRPRLAAEARRAFCQKLTALADYLQQLGLELAYHPHMGTLIQTEEDIQHILQGCGSSVRFALDSGHALFAGDDPVRLAQLLADRVVHLHCKNIRAPVLKQMLDEDASFLHAVQAGVFTVPGDPDGCIDFEAFLRVFAEKTYRGWLICEAEQDPERANPRQYATMGCQTLRDLGRKLWTSGPASP